MGVIRSVPAASFKDKRRIRYQTLRVPATDGTGHLPFFKIFLPFFKNLLAILTPIFIDGHLANLHILKINSLRAKR